MAEKIYDLMETYTPFDLSDFMSERCFNKNDMIKKIENDILENKQGVITFLDFIAYECEDEEAKAIMKKIS